MNQSTRTSGSSRKSVAVGCLVSGVAALVTFGTAIMIMVPMNWAAVFVFFPLMGIALAAWLAIVSIANRGNGAMWSGTLLFVVLAIVSYAALRLGNEFERATKREIDTKLGETLATSRVIESPVGPIDRLAVSGILCGNNVCGHALMFGMAKEVAIISQHNNWVTHYRLQPIEKCPTDNETYAAFVGPLQELGIFDACLRREKKVQSDPYSEIKDAVVISNKRGSDRVYRTVARKLENGHITEELARWEYFRSTYAQRSFGKRFSQTEFLEALTGMHADKDKAFVKRSFADAVRHIKGKIGRIKMEYRAVSSYLHKLVRDTRAKTGGPVVVTKATDDELQAIIEHLCFAKTSEKSHCSKGFESLRSTYNMEIRP